MGDEMAMPGIVAAVALAALSGGGWSSQPTEAVPLSGGEPELRIAHTVTPNTPIIGEGAVYAVSVTNAGGQDAEDVTISGTLDPGMDPDHLPDGCSLADQTVTCGGPGLTVPPGQSVAYEIPVTIDPALLDGTDITTRAHVTASNAPADTTALTGRARTMADVKVVTTGPSSVDEGAGVTYRVKVRNNGPSRAADVTVRGSIDGDRITLTGRSPECPAETCSLGTLAPGESRTLAFIASAGTGEIGTCATARTAGRDGNTANNRSCTSTAVEPVPAPTPSPPPTPTPSVTETPTPPRAEPGHAGDLREEPRAVGPSRPSEPSTPGPALAGDKAAHDRESLPIAGVSWWLMGLGAPMLLAVGLLVRHFSRRERSGGSP
ncbi:CARDB domain-containing protein [Nonomuraea polychroma]|uniref:CARDB domain-containing protein n=1 Tax=Nonomuraea polychroma TaxID=46176 RepID=UPI003D94791D